MSRGDELATTFEQVNADAIQAVEGCSEAKWQAKSEAEDWTAAALAHHVAAAHTGIFSLVQTIASGQELPKREPQPDSFEDGNARHAKEFETVSKQDVLALLRDAATTVPAGAAGADGRTVGDVDCDDVRRRAANERSAGGGADSDRPHPGSHG